MEKSPILIMTSLSTLEFSGKSLNTPTIVNCLGRNRTVAGEANSTSLPMGDSLPNSFSAPFSEITAVRGALNSDVSPSVNSNGNTLSSP